MAKLLTPTFSLQWPGIFKYTYNKNPKRKQNKNRLSVSLILSSPSLNGIESFLSRPLFPQISSASVASGCSLQPLKKVSKSCRGFSPASLRSQKSIAQLRMYFPQDPPWLQIDVLSGHPLKPSPVSCPRDSSSGSKIDKTLQLGSTWIRGCWSQARGSAFDSVLTVWLQEDYSVSLCFGISSHLQYEVDDNSTTFQDFCETKQMQST